MYLTAMNRRVHVFWGLSTSFATKHSFVWKHLLSTKTINNGAQEQVINGELSHLKLLTLVNGENQNNNHNKRCFIILPTIVKVDKLFSKRGFNNQYLVFMIEVQISSRSPKNGR